MSDEAVFDRLLAAEFRLLFKGYVVLLCQLRFWVGYISLFHYSEAQRNDGSAISERTCKCAKGERRETSGIDKGGYEC
jgi:hypothetical protein